MSDVIKDDVDERGWTPLRYRDALDEDFRRALLEVHRVSGAMVRELEHCTPTKVAARTAGGFSGRVSHEVLELERLTSEVNRAAGALVAFDLLRECRENPGKVKAC